MTSFATFLLTRLLFKPYYCIMRIVATYSLCTSFQICWNIEFQSIGSKFQSDIRSKQVIFSWNFSWLKKNLIKEYSLPFSFLFSWINKVLFGRKWKFQHLFLYGIEMFHDTSITPYHYVRLRPLLLQQKESAVKGMNYQNLQGLGFKSFIIEYDERLNLNTCEWKSVINL